ncbi:MAG: restriction endonuclease [Lachnospiraceae bacterium]|nr:restriction endonuclease [Lachnospiraceae bacterium]MBQ1400282.1 restriction endonuclease [Lachnospiraceae bacterium]
MKNRTRETNPNDRIMAEHVERGYWYWNSILSEAFWQLRAYTDISDEKITSVIYDYMLDCAGLIYSDGITVMEPDRSVAARLSRAIRPSSRTVSGPDLFSYVKAALSELEPGFRETWKENVGAQTMRGYAQDRKALVDWITRYIEETDADGLFLTECISVDDHSQAAARIYERLDRVEQADEEAVTTGIVMLVLYALKTAMQIDSVKERLPANDDFVRMIENTLAEYRNVETVTAHTWEIYCRDYTAKTGGRMMINAYKIFVAKYLLDGTDHVYEPYEEALKPVIVDAYNRAADIGEYRARIFRELTENAQAYDMAHPKALHFYAGAALRPLVGALSFEGVCRLFMNAGAWEADLAAGVAEARTDSERDRFIRGDFSPEHRYLDGDMSLAGIRTGEEFEEFLQNIFFRLGYDAQLTSKAGGDQGADLILKKQGIVYVVQAKFYGKPVGNKAVQEVTAAVRYYTGNAGIVVTNSTYTKQAVSLARKNTVILIDGEALKELIRTAYSERALTHMF